MGCKMRWLSLLVAAAPLLVLATEIHVAKFDESPGLCFREEGTVQVYNTVWTLVAYVSISELENNLKNVQHYYGLTECLCASYNDSKICKSSLKNSGTEMTHVLKGANSHGQLGLGINSEQCNLPQEVNTTMCCLSPENIDMIVGGGGHSLILTKHNNLVFGCGWNASGQLGCRDYIDRNMFTLIRPLIDHTPKALACGWDWSAGITDWGELMTWGSNAYCQLGFPKRLREHLAIPGFISPMLPVTQIACGLRHMAAVTECGQVLTWGSSRRNALGIIGDLGKPAECISHPCEVPGLADVVKVTCGQHHTVALTSKGRVYVWGDNKFGQLGLDPEEYPSIVTPTELDLSGLPHITAKSQLVSGWTHTAIVTDDGHVINWGRNCYGQLGYSQHTRSTPWQPQAVQGIGKVKTLSLGSEHNIALTASNRLMSWGWNEHGNCGTGTQENVHQPVPVVTEAASLENVVCLGSGYGHSFAVSCS